MRIRLNWKKQVLYPVNMAFDKKVDGGAFRLFGILFSLREQERDIREKELAKMLRCSCGMIDRYIQNLIDRGWVSWKGEVITLNIWGRKP